MKDVIKKLKENNQDYEFKVMSCGKKPKDAIVQIHHQDFEEEVKI